MVLRRRRRLPNHRVHTPAPRPRGYRPFLESLEDRLVLSLSPTTWAALGPAPILGGPYPASGRINVAVPDPSNPNVMYVGADKSADFRGGGGIWKTTNWLAPTPTWTPLIDTMPSTDVYVHGLTIAPTNPSVLYAAANGPDGGILQTTDAGAHWTLITTPTQFPTTSFGAIVVSPADPNTVFAAVAGDPDGNTAGGVWQLTFNPTTGTWTTTNITPESGAGSLGPVFVSDLVVDPADANVLYAGVVRATDHTKDGIYKITVSSDTWTPLTLPLPSGKSIGNYIELAIAATAQPDQPVLYATVLYSDNQAGSPDLDHYRSGDGGGTWIKLAQPATVGDNRDWHQVLAIDPTNPNRIYINGAEPNLFQCTVDLSTGAIQATKLDPEYGTSGTEDVLGVTFDDTGSAVVLGDRGIGRSNSATVTPGSFQPRQGNLSTDLVYNLALPPTDPTTAYAVSQDNSTAEYHNGQWTETGINVEIGKFLVDPANPNVVYNLRSAYAGSPLQLIPNFLTRSDSAGAPGSWKVITSGINGSDFPPSSVFDKSYYSAFAMDPGNPNHLVLGTTLVYQTTNADNQPAAGVSWSALSPVLSPGAHITAIDVTPAASPTSPNTIYAATSDGKFFVGSSDPAGTWTESNGGLFGSAVPGGSRGTNHVESIAIDPANVQHVFAVTSADVTLDPNHHPYQKVWVTTDGGTQWTPLTGDLPGPYQVLTLAADWRFTNPVLYVGTSRGAFRSTDGGTTWSRFGQGMPATEVHYLELLPQAQGGVLAAGTFGRGAYEISAPAEPTLTITGPATATEGDDLTYTVTVSNNTPADASNVVFTYPLPAGLRFVSANFGMTGCTFASGTLTCAIRTLPSGGSVTGTITAQAIAAGVQTSQGSVRGTLPVTSPAVVSASAATTVVSPPLVGSGVPLQGLEGAALGGVMVATFTHASGLQPAGAFTASIAWGDGTTSPGTVVQDAGGYTVQGSHTYTDEGSYKVAVTVAGDGVTATFPSTATVQAVLPDGTRGTPTERFVAELFGDLFGARPTAAQLTKYTRKVKASHAKFVTTLLASKGFEKEFLAQLVSVFFTALGGGSVSQGVHYLGKHSPEQLAQHFSGRATGAADPLLVQALVGQFLDRPATGADAALLVPLLRHAGKEDKLAADLAGSPEYDAKTSP
jgi:uncharacterized repeat protein (TIGR01451 family)